MSKKTKKYIPHPPKKHVRKSRWGTTLLYSAIACLLGVVGVSFWLEHAKVPKPQKEEKAAQEDSTSQREYPENILTKEEQEPISESTPLPQQADQEKEIPQESIVEGQETGQISQEDVISDYIPPEEGPNLIVQPNEEQPGQEEDIAAIQKTEQALPQEDGSVEISLGSSEPISQDNRNNIENITLPTLLQDLLEGKESTLGFSGRFEIPFKDVERLYGYFNFFPLWMTDLQKTACKEKVINMLNHSADEGLEAADYDWIQQDLQKFMAQAQDATLSEKEQKIALLKADILLTQALIQFASDARGERLSPKKIDKELFLEDVKVDEVKLLIAWLEIQDKECTWLAKISPAHPQYQALKNALHAYRKKENEGKNIPTLSKGPTLKKGMKDARVAFLWQILQEKGLLPAGEQTQDFFDGTLEEAVKTFQTANGLKADGVVGEKTQYLLSRNVQDIINQIIVTMERWRWMPQELGNKYIFINIPEFLAKTYEAGKLVFSMPIIVGKSYRETPVFASKIINIILNPSWNVPRLIAVADKLPDIQKKGPEVLIQKGFHVYQNGVEVDPRTINWHAVSKGNFNFHFRQDPGNQNALGRLRFTIVNPFDVYMHGTPDQKLFGKTNRTFSSGCIRLEDPIKMAVFILEDPKKWSSESVQATIDTKKTQTIPLKTPVQVYLSYFTVVEEENGQLIFLEDVYGQDKQILQALKSRRSRAP